MSFFQFKVLIRYPFVLIILIFIFIFSPIIFGLAQNEQCPSGYKWDGTSCITYTEFCKKFFDPHSYGDEKFCYCEKGYVIDDKTNKCIPFIDYCKKRFGENVIVENDECVCKNGYAFDDIKKKCIPLIDYCKKKFGENSIAKNNDCICKEGYVFDKTNKCVPLIDFCKDEFGENITVKNNQCVCKEGFIFDETKNKCISLNEYCQKTYGENVIAENGECVCKEGYVIDENNKKCILATDFCSAQIPNSIPYKDPKSNAITCKCKTGYIMGSSKDNKSFCYSLGFFSIVQIINLISFSLVYFIFYKVFRGLGAIEFKPKYLPIFIFLFSFSVPITAYFIEKSISITNNDALKYFLFAFVEEILKFLFFVLVILSIKFIFKDSPEFSLNHLIFIVFNIAFGFGFIENILLIYSNLNPNIFYAIIWRLSALLVHIISTTWIVLVYYFRKNLLLIGVLSASSYHFLYNYFILYFNYTFLFAPIINILFLLLIIKILKKEKVLYNF
jgi:hypothetical protein